MKNHSFARSSEVGRALTARSQRVVISEENWGPSLVQTRVSWRSESLVVMGGVWVESWRASSTASVWEEGPEEARVKALRIWEGC